MNIKRVILTISIFLFFTCLLIYPYFSNMNYNIPIGWDTPKYIFYSNGFQQYGITWLSEKTTDISYPILESTLSQITGINYFNLEIILPIILSLIIAFIIMKFSLLESDTFLKNKFSFIFIIFWFSLFFFYKSNHSTLLFLIVFLILILFFDRGQFLNAILFSSLLITHFQFFVLAFGGYILYFTISKKINKDFFVNFLVPFSLISLPWIALMVKKFIFILYQQKILGNYTPLVNFKFSEFLTFIGQVQLILLLFSFIYIIKSIKSKNNIASERMALIWNLTLTSLFILSVFGLITGVYYRFFLLLFIPFFLGFSIDNLNKNFTKKAKIIFVFILISLLTIQTISFFEGNYIYKFNNGKYVYISDSALNDIYNLGSLKIEKGIVPIFPISSGIGNWVLALKGDYIFYGTLQELMNNKVYNNYTQNELALYYAYKEQLPENIEDYRIIIIPSIYQNKDFLKYNPSEVYNNIFEISQTQNP